MIKRKKTEKEVRKKTWKAKPTTKKAKETNYNQQAQWEAYRELQTRAEEAWEKFRSDVQRKVKSDILIQDHNHLLLILAECNYMARECMRMQNQMKKKG